MTGVKRCPKCGETKLDDSFYGVRASRDGLDSRCKECKRAEAREYRQRNLDRVRAHDRIRAMANADEKRARASEWYYANRDQARLSRRSYYERNRSKIIANAMVARARRLGAPEIEWFTREEIIDRDRGICHVCGDVVPRDAVELDHVIPLAAGGPHTRANVKVAHKKCNAERRLIPTHCPHGHPYDDENTRVRRDGSRACRACAREGARRQPA